MVARSVADGRECWGAHGGSNLLFDHRAFYSLKKVDQLTRSGVDSAFSMELENLPMLIAGDHLACETLHAGRFGATVGDASSLAFSALALRSYRFGGWGEEMSTSSFLFGAFGRWVGPLMNDSIAGSVVCRHTQAGTPVTRGLLEP